MKKILVTLTMILIATSLFAAKKEKMTEKHLIDALEKAGVEYEIFYENEMAEMAEMKGIEENEKAVSDAKTMSVEEFVSEIPMMANGYNGPDYLNCQSGTYSGQTFYCVWSKYGSYDGIEARVYYHSDTTTTDYYYYTTQNYIYLPAGAPNYDTVYQVHIRAYNWFRMPLFIFPNPNPVNYIWVRAFLTNHYPEYDFVGNCQDPAQTYLCED